MSSNKSKYRYFYKTNFLNNDLLTNLYQEILEFEKENEKTIDQSGKIITNLETTNHIRNNCLDETFLDSILSPTLIKVKNLIRPYVVEHGLNKPMCKGMVNYYNPDTIKWHKDFISDEMYIDDYKRFVTFLVTSPKPIKSNFLVSSHPESVKLWGLGFHLDLEPNMLIGHNQHMGHEYNKLEDSTISIFSFLWYDTV